MELRQNAFFLTLLPCVYQIQMGTWATLILGISSDLFNCALHGFSEEGMERFCRPGNLLGAHRIAWKCVERTVGDGSISVAHNWTLGFPDVTTYPRFKPIFDLMS